MIEPKLCMNNHWVLPYKVSFWFIWSKILNYHHCKTTFNVEPFVENVFNIYSKMTIAWKETWKENSLDGPLQDIHMFIAILFTFPLMFKTNMFLWNQREKWLLFQVLTKEKWETTGRSGESTLQGEVKIFL
jgi:hypothetical protein